MKWPLPEMVLWAWAPPSSSSPTSSPITALITWGPVMYMLETLSTMKTKSVMAGL